MEILYKLQWRVLMHRMNIAVLYPPPDTSIPCMITIMDLSCYRYMLIFNITQLSLIFFSFDEATSSYSCSLVCVCVCEHQKATQMGRDVVVAGACAHTHYYP